ncbi:MAG: cupredoxin domain-containing protein, partial [Actinobacteria bacterium]|nr:cupredoxin domain-containing protein [Actinomycetota bacterium]
EPGQVAVAARNIAFDTDRLSAPASQPFTIAFDNQDAGVPHNVSIYPGTDGSPALFEGDIITGPGELTYEVSAQPAGTYSFVCDVHPVQMVGTLVIE